MFYKEKKSSRGKKIKIEMPYTHQARQICATEFRDTIGVHRAIYFKAQVLKQRVVFPEHRVESLAVCTPHKNKQCSSFYAKDLPLNAERQCLRCAWV